MYDFSSISKDTTKQKIYDDFLINLCSDSSPLNQSGNETNLGSIFENEANKLLRDLGFIGNGYEVFSHESKNIRGRTDFQYGNTIIEYKKYNLLGIKLSSKKPDISEEQNQIQDYLKDPKFSGFKMYGFLFDGAYIYIYIKDEDDTITHDATNSGKLTRKNLDILIKTLFGSGIIAISPANLKRDFGIVSATTNQILDNDEVRNLAKYLFVTLKNESRLNSRTLLLYREWEKLFRLAENDNGQHQDIIDRREIFSKIFDELIEKDSEYKAFFALHTTLSIIIKLLLVRIVNDMPKIISPLDLDELYKTSSLKEIREFFTKMEQGNYFNKIGIVNLTDNDFFAWYVKESFTAELKEIMQKLIFKICSYENIYIAKNTAMLDMFKELYLNFIPKVVRHSFGEYYTPYWLAERTLLSATNGDRNLKERSFIDPNCGSGTFLSVFFNHKYKDLKDKIDFKEYVKDIVGVDINPIAVLMARANVLISGLKKCNFNLNEKYEIPVYLADSLYVPSLIEIDKVSCFDYELYTTGLQRVFDINSIKITLPKDLVLMPNFMDIINEVEKHIVRLDEKGALKVFENAYAPIKKSKELNDKIGENISNLIKFEKEKLNSIWLKIFSNYFRVASYEKFDYIIGNPAWVQWSVLPENYRVNIKQNMRMDGLFSSDKNVGGNNLNICALIANKCCERWLSDDGAFCFLMPKSILFNKSFEGFRNLKINGNEQLYFNEFIDFSNGGEIFEGVGLDFCAFKISKKPLKSKTIVPFIDYIKKPNLVAPTHNDEWKVAKDSFDKIDKFAIALNTNFSNNFLLTDSIERATYLQSFIGKCEYNFRSGVSVQYQMRIEFKELKNDKIGIFYPYAKFGGRVRADKSKEIELELEYIKPFVTAPMLTDSGLDWENSYAICPYAVGSKKPLPKDELKRLAPLIYRYLDSIDDELGNGSKFNARVQNFDENYGILRMGSYTWGSEFVCIRDNTRLAPNHINIITTDWGDEITPLLDGHINYVSEIVDKKGNHQEYIGYKEARYILEKLKDSAVNEIIISSQDSRSISSRLPIKIPRYKK
ncbi:TPA: N-6 DNA methylase [Campylobacter coli]|uniref:Eco57I restriction-modification methylase domain-containing protein n=1 Tax=Campylobacter coli TaxID=195 RepID=UPI000931E16C|nr:N-6 DNA methylase [Campylobacter coli]HEB7536809.1 N-6 DNA methylase [Campylobacter coli]HEB7550441.1 N-6 DNA methylase [Campylobacter coli]HEB9431738.1 N-6 DNA methylase [Campylobacter coli]HEB9432791.1 N-6 DNA methylase [Campylobacter coli]